MIGTKVAREFGSQLRAYFNIEGNLIEQDAYFSGQAVQYQSASQFKQDFMQQIYKLAQDDIALKRYLASVTLAHPDALMGWGKSSVEWSPLAGTEFAALDCEKLYYWGKSSTQKTTQHFISSMSIPNKQFTDSGHWPMIDQPDSCSDDILRFLLNYHNKV